MRRLLFSFCLAFLASSPLYAESEAVSTHGDWSLECSGTNEAESRNCSLVNRVMDESEDAIQLDVFVWHSVKDHASILQVRAPLGVLLTAGLGLKIDNKDIGSAGFVRCLPEGCFVEMAMDEALIQTFLNGKDALFIVFKSPNEGVGIPVSMAGFREGYTSLTKAGS